jgi:hypothetical protein
MRLNNCSRQLKSPAEAVIVVIVLLATLSQTLGNVVNSRPYSVSQPTNDDADWNAFKLRYKKNYGSPAEESYRLVCIDIKFF